MKAVIMILMTIMSASASSSSAGECTAGADSCSSSSFLWVFFQDLWMAFWASWSTYWTHSSLSTYYWSWQNTLLVSASTAFNTFLFFTVIYFWWANRQFHFRKRKKDGSRLSSVATREDALELQKRQKIKSQKQRQRQERKRRRRASHLVASATTGGSITEGRTDSETDDDSEEEQDLELSELEKKQAIPKKEEEEVEVEDLESDLSDYEEDDEEKKAKQSKQTPRQSVFNALSPEKRQSVRDMTAVVASMEVFSYLSQEAFVQCLEFMEYKNLDQGQVLLQEDTYDGSLYVVVKGQVQCQFQLTGKTAQGQRKQQQQELDEEEDEEPIVSFIAGDGDVVTSLLSMLAGLVRQCQLEEASKSGSILEPAATLLQTTHTGVVPKGISVKAMAVVENTQVVRVPPNCFRTMLDKFPNDVHRIAQTVVARMQRVTLQTVVRCLGLQKEIVRHSNTAKEEEMKMEQLMERHHPKVWANLKEQLSKIYAPANENDNLVQLQQCVNEDAAIVAACRLTGTGTKNHYNNKANMTANGDTIQEIANEFQAQGAAVVALPPGRTLLEAGHAPDAIYLVLQGALNVGMHIPGAGSSTPAQRQQRRASTSGRASSTGVAKGRRSIFPVQYSGSSSRNVQKDKATTNTKSDASTSTTAPPPVPSPAPIINTTSKTSTTSNGSSFSRLYQAPVGEVIGTLSCFTGDGSIVTVKNASEWESALLYKIPKEAYDRLVADNPMALTECLGSILDRLGSPVVCLLDWNVEWMHVQAGEDVVHRGTECDAMYAVLNGRLRAAVPSLYPMTTTRSKSNSRAPQPMPDGSFLSRAKMRLHNRRIRFKNRNNPKVANAPPAPSRRINPNPINSAGEEVHAEEFGRGSIIGEVEILTGANWENDVHASRHSELARVPVGVLNAIINMCPRAGLYLAKVVAMQIQQKRKGVNKKNMNPMATLRTLSSGNQSAPSPSTPTTGVPSPSAPATTSELNILPSYGLNLATIAVVPLLEDRDFDLDGFCHTLQHTLHNIAPTKLVTKVYARHHLGDDVFLQRNSMHSLKMTRLCGDMEENYRLVIYQADDRYTWWTRFCIQQADCILLVVRAEQAPPSSKVEACLKFYFTALNVKIQLVVLQSPTNYRDTDDDDDEIAYQALETIPSSDQLNDWSEQRYWIAGHHLIRMPFKRHVHDFRRLCRRVTGRTIGVVFGGGGARGLAHIGVIQALMEAGITVDFVGGTSQVAYIGALYASSPDDFSALVRDAKKMADSMANNWERLRDLTLPLVSFFSGYRFNRGIQKTLGRRRIQDLVCNFFCVSTDIRNNVQVVHTKGVCWRYVRASMTLQSYLPPMSEDGTLLVDGGYMNVLPADVMKKQMQARTVIAVDVSQEVVLDNYEYGSHLNGWWLLYNSWNPFVKTVKVPSMGDISERLAWVSGERHKKKVREHIDLFLQPPVGNYGVLEYDKFDDIVKLGYEYAKPRVDNFVKKHPHLVS